MRCEALLRARGGHRAPWSRPASPERGRARHVRRHPRRLAPAAPVARAPCTDRPLPRRRRQPGPFEVSTSTRNSLSSSRAAGRSLMLGGRFTHNRGPRNVIRKIIRPNEPRELGVDRRRANSPSMPSGCPESRTRQTVDDQVSCICSGARGDIRRRADRLRADRRHGRGARRRARPHHRERAHRAARGTCRRPCARRRPESGALHRQRCVALPLPTRARPRLACVRTRADLADRNDAGDRRARPRRPAPGDARRGRERTDASPRLLPDRTFATARPTRRRATSLICIGSRSNGTIERRSSSRPASSTRSRHPISRRRSKT